MVAVGAHLVGWWHRSRKQLDSAVPGLRGDIFTTPVLTETTPVKSPVGLYESGCGFRHVRVEVNIFLGWPSVVVTDKNVWW